MASACMTCHMNFVMIVANLSKGSFHKTYPGKAGAKMCHLLTPARAVTTGSVRNHDDQPVAFTHFKKVCHKLTKKKTLDIQEVIQEIHSNVGNTVKIYSRVVCLDPESLTAKMTFLASLGCSIESILSHPVILQCSVMELQSGAEMLKSVELTTSCPKMLYRASRTPISQKTGLASQKSTEQYLGVMAELLNCPIVRLKEKSSNIGLFCSRPDFVMERVKILLDAGYSASSILGSLSVVKVRVETLLRRLDMMESEGVERLSLGILASSERQFLSSFESAVKSKRSLGNFDSQWDLLANMLGRSVSYVKDICPKGDIGTIKERIETLLGIGFTPDEIAAKPRLLRVPCKDLGAKVELLVSNGATLQDLKKSVNVLFTSLEVLQSRIDELKSCGLDKPLPVQWLSQAQQKYRKNIKKGLEKKDLLEVHSDRFDCIASMLGTTAERVKERFPSFRLETLKPKIQCLLNSGLIGEYILTKSYLLKKRLGHLQEAEAFIRANELTRLDCFQISRLVFDRTLSPSSVETAQKHFIAKMLGCHSSHLKQYWGQMKPIRAHTEDELKEILSELSQIGIYKEHVCRCPLVLNHSIEVIKSGIVKLNSVLRTEELNASRKLSQPSEHDSHSLGVLLSPGINHGNQCDPPKSDVSQSGLESIENSHSHSSVTPHSLRDIEKSAVLVSADLTAPSVSEELSPVKKLNILQYLIEKDQNFLGEYMFYGKKDYYEDSDEDASDSYGEQSL